MLCLVPSAMLVWVLSLNQNYEIRSIQSKLNHPQLFEDLFKLHKDTPKLDRDKTASPLPEPSENPPRLSWTKLPAILLTLACLHLLRVASLPLHTYLPLCTTQQQKHLLPPHKQKVSKKQASFQQPSNPTRNEKEECSSIRSSSSSSCVGSSCSRGSIAPWQ